MKTLILLAFLCLFSLKSQAQTFKGLYEEIGKSIDQIIKEENYLIGDTLMNNSFESAAPMSNGGLYLVYSMNFDNKRNETVYYFDKNKNCIAFKTIQDIDNLGRQLKMLSSEFRRVGENTLYHSTLNFKVVYNTDLPNKLCTFMYSHK